MKNNDCVYLGDQTDDKEVYQCQVNDRCCPSVKRRRIANCKDCKQKLSLQDEDFAERWIDPLKVIDRRRKKTDGLRNVLAGASVFLAGSGPSANSLDLEKLNGRGIWTMGVNNAAGHSRFRPQAMLCSDPPMKFSHSIWLDPQIIKIIPSPKMKGNRSKLRRKKEDGTFGDLDRRTHECPNVWGFQRDSWLMPDDSFFLGEGANWGNHKAGVERTGEPKTVCTLLLAFRVLRYLGARRVFLIGVDFRMAPGYGYSFNQARTEGACSSNNRQFSIVNNWLCLLQEKRVFERFGIEFFNCFRTSGLRAFPFVPFETALEEVRGIVEEAPSLSNWYEKK